MDINNAINQLQQSSADFMENNCVVNGNIWQIDCIEKMDLGPKQVKEEPDWEHIHAKLQSSRKINLQYMGSHHELSDQ